MISYLISYLNRDLNTTSALKTLKPATYTQVRRWILVHYTFGKSESLTY